MTIINSSRRNFLVGAGALGAASYLPGLGIIESLAQSAVDYKALVCVFLYGGNDGNNMVIPVETTAYNQYSAIRAPAGLAIPQGNVVPLNQSSGARYGLHPSLAPLAQVWDANALAVLFNAGPLVQPLTRAQYRSNAPRPRSLFSHYDQQEQWQSAVSQGEITIGWGGQVADRVNAVNAGASVPMNISVAGNDVFLSGQHVPQYSIPATGTFGLQGFGSTPQTNQRYMSFQQLLTLDREKQLVTSAQDVIGGAVNASAVLNQVLNTGTSSVAGIFNGMNTGLARQLYAVAKMIEKRAQTGLKRQIFFVSQGGYDTHANQMRDQATRFNELGPALKAFYDATVALGVASNVTSFSLSDFGRTLKPNDSGSDHAWGNHHFILGGAVHGGQTYGAFPQHVLGGPDDSSSEGRWIPTTSVEQYGATLARWFGVSDADLGLIFPNLARFVTANIGFMG